MKQKCKDNVRNSFKERPPENIYELVARATWFVSAYCPELTVGELQEIINELRKEIENDRNDA